MRLIIAILLLCVLRCSAAFTNVVGLEVETNGWVLRATIGGDAAGSIGTNGNFFNGFGLNNTLSSNTLTVTVTSMGYDDAGAGKQVQRTVYGTKNLRRPYPMQNTNDIIATEATGTNVVFRIALSDFIYSTDSNLTATAIGGWISGTNGNSTNVSAISGQTITNSSTLVHPKCIANWSRPGWNHETNITVTLGVVAFHRSAQNGRPVRLVKFSAADLTGHVVTTNVLVPEIDKAYGDAVPIVEYIGRLDCSSLSNNTPIRCDFMAIPWVGNTNAVVDTADAVNTAPSPYYAGITNTFDTNFAQKVTIAVVDSVNGNDTNGKATNTTAGVVGSPAEALPFLTLGRAITAIAGTNNILYGRNDYGRGIIYLTNGFHSYCGSSATPGNVANAWVTITHHPAATRADVNLQRLLTGSTTGGTRLKFYDLTISATNGLADTAASVRAEYWFDRCVVAQTNAGTSAPLIQASGASSQAIVDFTRCIISNAPTHFKPFGSQVVGFSLLRGNDFTRWTNQITFHNFIGNLHELTNYIHVANAFLSSTGGAGDFSKTNWIFAFNRWYGWMSANAVNPIFISYNQGTEVNYWGGAIVQNVVEAWNGTNGNATLQIAADSATGAAVNNILVWHNTIVGQRANLCYNDTGTVSYQRDNWSIQGNAFDDDNVKSDTFGTPNAARIGNWQCLYGVGHAGNRRGEIVGDGGTVGASSLINEFIGLSSVWQTSLTNTLYRYTASGAWNGNAGGFGAGGGNYRLLNDSPFFRNSIQNWILPYDLEGVPRGRIDPPGAYSSGNTRKTVFFQP